MDFHKIEDDILKKGYFKSKVDSAREKYLKNISSKLLINTTNLLKEKNIKFTNTNLDKDFFDNFHSYISIEELNKFRVNLLDKLNSDDEVKMDLYNLCKPYMDEIVGNEVAIQRRVNLSIQLPNDNSSLLPVHADTWSGDSPFEAVLWLPLVDCYDTKSMYILSPNDSIELTKEFVELENLNAEDIFNKIKDKVEWINIKFGEFMIFNQSLPHGNVVNLINQTRWSLNCRFKSLYSPYGDKKLGEFFEPLNPKIMTKIGINYKYPEVD